MDTPPPERSPALAIVFWFLVIVAMSFVLLAAWQMKRSALQRPFEVKVESRGLNLVVREVRYSKPERLVPRLYGEYQLSMVRVDTGQTVKQAVAYSLSEEEVGSLEFLDRYEPGSRIQAIEQRDGSGTLDLEPGKRWFGVVGILFGAWMFGTFAWMVTDYYRIMQFLSAALLIVAVVVYVALLDRYEKGDKESRPRVAVEGFSKKLTREELVAELRLADVVVEERVIQLLDETLRFCEYQYGGRTWRTTSLLCQPPEGEPCPGRLNPDNPRDVKWCLEP